MIGMVGRLKEIWQCGDCPAGDRKNANPPPFNPGEGFPKGRGWLRRIVQFEELVDEVCTARNGGAGCQMGFEVRHVSLEIPGE